jgi:hypothetical protein
MKHAYFHNGLRLLRLGICGRHTNFEIAAPARQDFLYDWQLSNARINPRFVSGSQNVVRL